MSEARSNNEEKGDFAVLNDEGMDEFGEIFPEGKVPIRSLKLNRISTDAGNYLAYFTDFNKFSEEQKSMILSYFVTRFKATKKEILEDLKRNDYTFPIRTEMVRTVYSTDFLRYL